MRTSRLVRLWSVWGEFMVGLCPLSFASVIGDSLTGVLRCGACAASPFMSVTMWFCNGFFDVELQVLPDEQIRGRYPWQEILWR